MSNIEFSCDHFRLGTTTIFHLSSEHMTWNKSVEYCRNRGLELASIHSEEEWIKAKESGKTSTCMITLNGKQYGNGNCGPHQFSTCDWFWLGGHLNGTQVVWSDNTTFDWTPHLFELNFEPGHRYVSGWPTVSCYGKGGGWHDASGDWKMQALCKGSYSFYFSCSLMITIVLFPRFVIFFDIFDNN